MGSTINEEIIINKIPIPINNLKNILILILISLILLLSLYNYTNYYTNQGIIVKKNNNYYLKIKIKLKDLSKVINNNQIIIDNVIYTYTIEYYDTELYINKNNNYQYIYLNIKMPNQYKKENLIVSFKLKEKEEKIYKYIIGGI